MSWGRLKPFWKSKSWAKSAKKGTGFFSWGDSNFANFLDPTGSLDRAIDSVTVGEQNRLAGQASSLPSATEVASFVPTGFNISQNQGLVYLAIGLIAYKVIFK
mgnify:CR=1 FL=1